MNSLFTKLTNIELEISNPCNEHCVHCYRLCYRQQGSSKSRLAGKRNKPSF